MRQAELNTLLRMARSALTGGRARPLARNSYAYGGSPYDEPPFTLTPMTYDSFAYPEFVQGTPAEMPEFNSQVANPSIPAINTTTPTPTADTGPVLPKEIGTSWRYLWSSRA